MITSQLKMEKQEQVSLNFCISGKGNSKACLIFIISMFRSTCTEYRIIYGGYFSKALGPMLSKVPSSLNYSVIRVPGPGYLSSLLYSEVTLCSPLETSPSVSFLCHHLRCKSIWLWPLAFKEGEVLTRSFCRHKSRQGKTLLHSVELQPFTKQNAQLYTATPMTPHTMGSD